MQVIGFSQPTFRPKTRFAGSDIFSQLNQAIEQNNQQKEAEAKAARLAEYEKEWPADLPKLQQVIETITIGDEKHPVRMGDLLVKFCELGSFRWGYDGALGSDGHFDDSYRPLSGSVVDETIKRQFVGMKLSKDANFDPYYHPIKYPTERARHYAAKYQALKS